VEYAKGRFPFLQDRKIVYQNDAQYMIQPGVTVMICCHNGASRLPETIKHIAAQEVPGHIHWELMIVDNKSTDHSAAIARKEWHKYKCTAGFRIVPEPVLGLSHARAKGFMEARYEFVIMCDDDNWLASDYVRTVFDIMTGNQRIGALGGLGKLVFEVTPPKYIEYANIFAAGEQAPMTGKVKLNKIYGAGCVIRKSAYARLLELGFKSLLTDRKGHELSSGGDYELCYALAIAGYDIWYDDRLRFTHFISSDRLTWEYFIRYARESAQCFEVLACYKAVADDSRINKISGIHIARSFFYTLRRFIVINSMRLVVQKESDTARMLFFRHTVLRYKLATYVERLSQMIRIHQRISEFKAKCEAQPIEGIRSADQTVMEPVIKFTSFSKPFRQLR
jgi:glycosyltransferase involved in cell wall biosynthesis